MNTNQQAANQYETKAQLGERLQVSARTVGNWMAAGRIPYLKMDRAVRFNVAAVDEALKDFTIG